MRRYPDHQRWHHRRINAGLVPDEWNIATAVINTGVSNGVRTYRNGVLREEKTFSAWGNGGQVRLTFDMSAGKAGGLNSGDLVLLRRNGLSGDFAIIPNTPAVLGDRYSFVLNANNLSDGYYTVAEVDTTPPVITLTGGDLTIECGSGYTDPGLQRRG